MHTHQQVTRSRFVRAPIGAIMMSALCILFVACGVVSERDPVGPSGPDAALSDLSIQSPAPGHAWILTLASGTSVTVPGTGAEPVPTTSLCDIEWNQQQDVRIHSSPCSSGSCAGQPEPVLTSGEIPAGTHPITLVGFCSPYNIYDVDFSND